MRYFLFEKQTFNISLKVIVKQKKLHYFTGNQPNKGMKIKKKIFSFICNLITIKYYNTIVFIWLIDLIALLVEYKTVHL